VTPEEVAAAVAGPIGRLGAAFMTDRATLAHGGELGYQGWPFYFGGRGGVLGDVDADVVHAAFAFFPSDAVRRGWESARAVDPAQRNAEAYATCCREWGRAHLTGVPSLEELCELLELAAGAVEPPGLPLFAGWRAMALPEDPPARAAQLLHVMREHRGGVHAIAVLASGMRPLEAVVSGPNGAEVAAFLGWEPPYPDPAPLAERRAAAERATDVLAARGYALLGEDAGKRLARLVVMCEERLEVTGSR